VRALVDRLRALSAADRAAILGQFSAKELASLRWRWRDFWARPDEREPGAIEGGGQLPPPGSWTWWASIGGRGSGKTRSAAEWILEEAERLGRGCVIHLVGQSVDDARATMIEGESGLLANAPPWAGLDWRPSVQGGLLVWKNGARARVFGADKPAKGRGPQCNRMWLDDPAAWGPHGKEVLEQLLFGFRLRAPDGSEPRGVISSTPIESEILRWILDGTRGGRRSKIVYSRSATDDNRANLSTSFFDETLAEFAGTELEQQERYGIWNAAGAPKVFAGIDFNRTPVRVAHAPERFLAVAIWIDPAESTSTRACEVGMVAGGLTNDGHVYLLEDLSAKLGANEWPDRALDAVERWAPRAASVHLGVEINRGGNQPAELLRSAEKIRRLQRGLPGFSILEIRTVFTDKGKSARATPLPRLYAAGQVHHLPGLDELERQMRALDDTRAANRDRADAAVYVVLDLAGVLEARGGSGAYAVGGAAIGPGTFGAPALGAVAVGPSAPPSPAVTPHLSFTFGGTRP